MRTMLNCLLLAFLLLTVCATVAFSSDPVILGVSGTAGPGDLMTISGSGFGTKSPAAPLVWDTFENGTVGGVVENRPATIGTWDSGAGSDNVLYTNAISYAGGQAAGHPFTSSRWNSSLAKNATAFPVLYVDFKRYYPGSNGLPSNYKPWRFYGDNDALQFVMGFGCGYQVVTILDSAGVNQTDWSADSLTGKMDAWQHYQILYKESSTSASDGELHTWLNGIPDGFDSDAVQTRSVDSHIQQVRIGHYFDVGPRDGCDPADDAEVYTDNVYIDTTWSRVELGDKDTYAASTHREIQLPTSWGDGQVAVRVNIGAFAPGQTAYLYVIDAAGNVSNGKAVTIGSGPATSPARPDGLTVK